MSPRHRDDRLPVEALQGRRRRQRKRARATARRRKVVLLAIAGLLVLFVALAVGGFTAAATVGGSGCDLSHLRSVRIGQNSFVYAADGSSLGAIPSERNRQPVAWRQMSPWIKRATVAIEDRRFYEHRGIDPEGIARALWADIRAGRAVEGGSTITQQLVRNLYDQRERTLTRKLREACLALKLNDRWSKRRILRTYLNQVFYGNHAYGIEAASQTYFSRPARKLTLAQAALLAGLPQAPTVYDPFQHPARARARRNEVLRALLETRRIDLTGYRAAVRKRVRLRPGRLYERIREPYFFAYVRDLLVKRYGLNKVRSGGLKIYTTIDPRLQVAATRAIRNTLYYRSDPDAALVSIDPSDGAIRAMVGVTRRTGNQFNLATQARRQAGSTFKTFVLTAAISEGINPDWTTYVSAPFTYQPSDGGKPWPVSTYDGTAYGPSTVTSATLRSDNTVYAQLTLDVGPRKVAQMARRLGVDRSPLPMVPSLGLGSASVSPLELASAYATLAAGGVYSVPRAIWKVVLPDGTVDRKAGWGTIRRQRVIADWVAAEVTKILEQNVLSGTGTAAQIGRPAAGKTGTTDDHADAWFCGYTPNLETTVWVGHLSGRIPMLNVHGIAVAGGTFPAQIWARFMSVALEHAQVIEWPTPTRAPIWRSFSPAPKAITYNYSSGYSNDYSPQPTSPPVSPPTTPPTQVTPPPPP